MAEPKVQDENPTPSNATPRAPLGLAAVAALALGAAGYLAVGTGLVPGLSARPVALEEVRDRSSARPGTVFVALDPFMVTIPRTDPVRQLRLEVQLEVPKADEAEIRAMFPRFEDTMNTYLRAIDLSGIEDPDNLLRMRMQLLRRLQVAAGENVISDLLVTQFLIS